MTEHRRRKETGSYYTPDDVVRTLVTWAVRDKSDRLIDPASGDGRFVAAHRNSVGVEQAITAAQTAVARAP
jgi:type I restriction-modification system DNA methylase subunit